MLICHCFCHTEEDIRADALLHGRSTILARILAEKQGGTCACAEKNPRGT